MFGFNVKKKINSALKSNHRKPVFHNLNDMKTIQVLFCYEDWNDVYQIVRDLESKGKKVIMWTVEPKQHQAETIFRENVRFITQKDISKWFGLSSAVVNEFKSQSCDTLFDLTTKNDSSLLYLLANNSAEFCIGTRELDFKIFDFIMLKDESHNLQETYNQIKIYLNNIR